MTPEVTTRRSTEERAVVPRSSFDRLRTNGLVIAFGIIALLGILIRVPAVAEPLGVDQSFWASSARSVARGQMLFSEVWDHKPPGTTLTYLAAFTVFGWTPAAIALADIVAAALTALLLFLVARRLAGGVTGSLAAALYTTLTIPAWLYRHFGISERAVAETFIVVLVALAAWCATGLRDRPGRTMVAVALGGCCGAAVMFKPNAGVYFLALVAWLVVYSPARGRLLARDIAAAVGGTLIVPLLMLAWVWARGALPEARIALVDFNRMYVSQGLSLGGYATDLSKALWLRMKTDPLWLAGSVGAVVAVWQLLRTRRVGAVCGLAIAWGGASGIALAANGARLFSTYFIQALAPLALLAAWLFAGTARRTSVGRVAAVAAAVLMAALLVQRHYPAKLYAFVSTDLSRLTGRMNERLYLNQFGGYGNDRGYSALANDDLASFVRAHSAPGDSIYLFGINGAGIYFAADRRLAHRFLRVNFYVLGDFPDARFRLGSVTRDLAAARPVYLIFERLHSPPILSRATETILQQPEVAKLLEAYGVETQIEDFTVFRRLDR